MSDPDALARTLSQTGLALERVGFEACSLTAWLHDGLRARGFAALCIETIEQPEGWKFVLRSVSHPGFPC